MYIKTEQTDVLNWKLSFSGRLDLDGAGAARAALAAIPDKAEKIDIDCGELAYASLAGLRELLILRRRFPEAALRLENVRPRVLEALETAGFRDFFEITRAQERPSYTRQSFRDFLAQKRCEAGDRVAVVSEVGSHTWREIDACAERIAADLAKLGVRRGTHVAVCGRNSINWIYTFFAVQKLGAVATLINPGLTPAEIAAVADGGGAALLCYGEIAEMKDEAAFLKRITQASHGALSSFYSFRSAVDFRLRTAEPVCLPAEPVEADDPAVMIFTSGYTGTPKGVLLSSYGVLNASRGSAGNQRLTAEDRICLILPMFHIFGLVAGLVAGACANARLYIPKDIRTDTILELISRERCTVFHSVPAMLVALINNRRFAPEKLASLRCTIISATAATPAQMARFQAAMPANHFLSSYGLSEMAPVSITEYEDTDEHVMLTVGKPWPDIELKIVDRETGAALPTGADGEILVRGFSLMGGYYRLALSDQAIDADGWLHTGDRGYLDAEGYLRLLGRYKELIIRGGENVMPGEIECALAELDCVANVKVIGVPSDFFGEEVCACVVCRPGASFDEAAARAALSARLARYKVPSFFLVYGELPLLGSGKIDLAALKKDAVERIRRMQ
ncbi:MAG: acyl--CoA ligase [Oscillospiraceae bacterium]|nr:acyl--CoA ligase [Oscillospiraceae bacterium]